MMIGNNVENEVDLSTYEDDDELIQTPVSMHIEGESVEPNYPAHLSTLDDSLWLKIYENILTDLDWENKHHFALSCRFFKGIFDSDRFIEAFARRVPYIVDAPQTERANALAYRKGPLTRFLRAPQLTPGDDPKLYINWYIRNGLLFGYDFDELIRKLRAKLLNPKNKYLEKVIERKAHWIKAVQFAHQRDFPEDFNWDEIPFGEFLTCAAAAGNLRAMVALLDQKHLENATLTGLRWAVVMSKPELLSVLHTKRTQALRQRIAAMKTHGASIVEQVEIEKEDKLLNLLDESILGYDFTSLREILNIDLSFQTIGHYLQTNYFQKQMQTWHYDDLFVSMSPETFLTLRELSYYSLCFILPVFRTLRTDLLHLVDDSIGEDDVISANLIAQAYLALTAKVQSTDIENLTINDLVAFNRASAFLDAVNCNENVKKLINGSSVMFHRALDEDNEKLLREAFANGMETEMHWALTEAQRSKVYAFVKKYANEFMDEFFVHIPYFTESMLYEIARDASLKDRFRRSLETKKDCNLVQVAIIKLAIQALNDNNEIVLYTAVNVACSSNEQFNGRVAACLLDALKLRTKADFMRIEEHIYMLMSGSFIYNRVENFSSNALNLLFKFARIDFLVKFCEMHLHMYGLSDNLIVLTNIVRDRNNRELKNSFFENVIPCGLPVETLSVDDQVTWLKMIPTATAKRVLRCSKEVWPSAEFQEKLGTEHILTKYIRENHCWFNLDYEVPARKLPNPKKRK